MHKIYSDWSVVVRHILPATELAGLAIPANMSEQQGRELLQIGMDGLTLSPSTRERRLAELSIDTLLRLIRDAQQTASSRNNYPQQPTQRRIAKFYSIGLLQIVPPEYPSDFCNIRRKSGRLRYQRAEPAPRSVRSIGWCETSENAYRSVTFIRRRVFLARRALQQKFGTVQRSQPLYPVFHSPR